MSKDYRALQSQIAGDVNAAATSASLNAGSKKRRVRILDSNLPSLVPNGANVYLESVPLGKLAMGDIICVSLEGGPKLRRFVKLKMTKTDTLLLTAYEGFDKKEALPKSALVGKVAEAEAGGRTWDPAQEGPLKRFWGKLTEYGTHKPFGLG